MCDLFNHQIKHRIGRTGMSKRTRGEREKQDYFVFGCVALNMFNVYRDINEIADVEYDYYSFCAEIAGQLYTHSVTLSDAPL